MKYILICVEGGSSEPGIVKGFVWHLRGQAPASVCGRIEVVPLSLNGNHGYTEKLFEEVEKKVEGYIEKWEIKERQAEATEAKTADEVERFIVCDYDSIDKSKTTLEDLREEAEKRGFKLIVTRPKIEYFVAWHFFSAQELSTVNSASLAGKIQEGIDNYNADKEQFLQLLPYSKKQSAAERCLGALYNFDPSFIDLACDMEVDTSKEQFTELPELLRYIRELFNH